MYQYQCCARDFLWNAGIDHLLFIKPNHWATERRVLTKILYKPMAFGWRNTFVERWSSQGAVLGTALTVSKVCITIISHNQRVVHVFLSRRIREKNFKKILQWMYYFRQFFLHQATMTKACSCWNNFHTFVLISPLWVDEVNVIWVKWATMSEQQTNKISWSARLHCYKGSSSPVNAVK